MGLYWESPTVSLFPYLSAPLGFNFAPKKGHWFIRRFFFGAMIRFLYAHHKEHSHGLFILLFFILFYFFQASLSFFRARESREKRDTFRIDQKQIESRIMKTCISYSYLRSFHTALKSTKWWNLIFFPVYSYSCWILKRKLFILTKIDIRKIYYFPANRIFVRIDVELNLFLNKRIAQMDEMQSRPGHRK